MLQNRILQVTAVHVSDVTHGPLMKENEYHEQTTSSYCISHRGIIPCFFFLLLVITIIHLIMTANNIKRGRLWLTFIYRFINNNDMWLYHGLM